MLDLIVKIILVTQIVYLKFVSCLFIIKKTNVYLLANKSHLVYLLSLFFVRNALYLLFALIKQILEVLLAAHLLYFSSTIDFYRGLFLNRVEWGPSSM